MKKNQIYVLKYTTLIAGLSVLTLFGCDKETNSPSGEGIFEATYRGNPLPESTVWSRIIDDRYVIVSAEFYTEDNIMTNGFSFVNLNMESGYAQQLFPRSLAGDSLPRSSMYELVGGDVIGQVYDMPPTPQEIRIDSFSTKYVYLSFDSILYLRDTTRDAMGLSYDSILLTDGFIAARIRE